ncbi:hypothetical protein HDK77DRAFT_241866 [Phyllosticta capitalensis]
MGILQTGVMAFGYGGVVVLFPHHVCLIRLGRSDPFARKSPFGRSFQERYHSRQVLRSRESEFLRAADLARLWPCSSIPTVHTLFSRLFRFSCASLAGIRGAMLLDAIVSISFFTSSGWISHLHTRCGILNRLLQGALGRKGQGQILVPQEEGELSPFLLSWGLLSLPVCHLCLSRSSASALFSFGCTIQEKKVRIGQGVSRSPVGQCSGVFLWAGMGIWRLGGLVFRTHMTWGLCCGCWGSSCVLQKRCWCRSGFRGCCAHDGHMVWTGPDRTSRHQLLPLPLLLLLPLPLRRVDKDDMR